MKEIWRTVVMVFDVVRYSMALGALIGFISLVVCLVYYPFYWVISKLFF